MRFVSAALAVFVLSAAALALTLRRAERNSVSSAADDSLSPVVVELFTSEGCSSCPPADALLARLDQEGRVNGAEIIALEEHVDYWDQLGWRDPFSSYQWTERQREYSDAFHTDSIYTPQMVIDGAAEFVGSREGQARQAIRDAAAKPKAEVHVKPTVTSPGHYQLKIDVQMLPSFYQSVNAQVWLAVTETGLHSNVKAGENSGEDLHHAAVVRSLQSVGSIKKSATPLFSAEPTVSLSSAWKRENVRFAVFVQDKKTLRILGAAAARPQ